MKLHIRSLKTLAKKPWIFLVFPLCVILTVCCGRRQSFKERLLNECWLEIDSHYARTEVADSLINTILKKHSGEYSSFYRDEDSLYSVCLTDTSSVDAIKKLCRHNILYMDLDGRPREIWEVLFNLGMSKASKESDIIEIVSRYSRGKSPSDEIRINKICYKYAAHCSDTLQCICLYGITDGVTRQKSSERINKEALKYAELGLKAAYSATSGNANDLNYAYFLEKCAEFSEPLPQGDFYADSLFQYNRHRKYSGGTGVHGPLFARYHRLLHQGNYELAQEYLDSLLPIPTLCTLNPDTPYDSLPDTLLDYWSIGQALRTGHKPKKLDKRPLNRFTVALLGPLDIIADVESARVRYLKGDTLYSQYLNAAFLHSAEWLCPLGEHDYIDYFLKPDHSHDANVIDWLPYLYNNADSRMVYNSALLIKGTGNDIFPALYGEIRDSANFALREYVDSIKQFNVFDWRHFSVSRAEHDDSYKSELTSFLKFRLRSILSKSFVSCVDIKKKLNAGEAAVEFFRVLPFSSNDEPEYRAAVIRADDDVPIVVEIGKESRLKDVIIRNGNPYCGGTLYNIVWKPIEKLCDNCSTVYFSTDGLLNMLNVLAISDDRKNCLMDKYKLVQLLSTKDILKGSYQSDDYPIALFGGLDYTADNPTVGSIAYLNESLAEVEAISDIAENNGVTVYNFCGHHGSEPALRSLSGQRLSVIHFATHGFYYPENKNGQPPYLSNIKDNGNPLSRCGLLLANSEPAWAGGFSQDCREDGILLGSEVSRLDFSKVNLIVLSACNTGVGDLNAEGITGLQSAFKRAGANSILCTLSRVDDSVAKLFMPAFYKKLLSGASPHDSYNAAILTLRRSGFENPRYWAPFILIS